MAANLQGLGILRGQDADCGIAFDGAGELHELIVDAADQGGLGESWPDGFSDVEYRRSSGNVAAAAVG
jgi:hypothetical protein